MKVWLLDGGSIVIEHTQLMWNVPGPQARIPVYSVLVEHDEGLFLIDTGIDLDHMNRVLPFELPEQTEEQTIPAQLARAGFELGDVTTVVNSHLHIDHVGGNQLFKGTGVRHVLHERELDQARNHEPFEFFGYSDTSWDYDGARFETVSGDVELAKGLWLHETPGHTVGHYSVLVAPEGAKPMLFVLDVVYTAAAFEKGIQPGFHNDPVAGVRSIARVKTLAEEHGADLFFSHDADAWQATSTHPTSTSSREDSMGKLDNRVAIVTGAAQGIGKAVADKLADEGATVVGADIQDGVAMQVDVSREEDVRRLVEDTVGEHGKLDVLVNVAAIVPFTPWDEVDFAEWRRVLSVNLDGTFLTNYYAQKAMRENGYGRIVNIASNVILAGTPNLAHYVASKGGVWAFTRALARELGQYGITVNSVAPGLTETEGVLASKHAEAFDFVQMLQAIPRRAVAADIAPAVAFLASEEAGWVTGQLIVADGGHTHN